MFTIMIPLKHIIIDPAKPVDLSALSEQAAMMKKQDLNEGNQCR
jgi:hypothetical protein